MAYHIELPQINGLSEKEQLSQLNKYLYRQAEQLQWALNDLEGAKTGSNNGSKSPQSTQSTQSASGIFGSIKGLIKNSDEIFKAYAAMLGDFVTEVGTTEDGWTYKKWNRGTYEMFGRFEVTPTSSEKGESLYITNAIQIPTPFEIINDAVITGMGEGDYWLTGGTYDADAGAISIKIISDKAISTAEASAVRLRVVGTYVTTNTEEENGDSQSN